ncbi:MAG TPA: AAA family ATPase [Anaerolineae bacterium]|nr:AAA family ATPase [Anaerolineae bacterium]
MPSGKIIFMNGPSSTGKTAIAKELQQLIDEPYLHVGVDIFYNMMPRRYFGKDPSEGDPAYQGFRWRTVIDGDEIWYDLTPGPIGYRLLEGMYRAIAGLASAGNNLIVDENVIYDGQLEGYLATLRDFEILFVGVRCSLEEIERREHERGDRWIGHAKGHYHLTHALVDAHGSYDLDIDSTNLTPLKCAKMIKGHMESGPPPNAFRQLGMILLKENMDT